MRVPVLYSDTGLHKRDTFSTLIIGPDGNQIWAVRDLIPFIYSARVRTAFSKKVGKCCPSRKQMGIQSKRSSLFFAAAAAESLVWENPFVVGRADWTYSDKELI
jgi:hypothetical protein